jgi:dienelactone hydrolase
MNVTRRWIATVVFAAIALVGMFVLSRCTSLRCAIMSHQTEHVHARPVSADSDGWLHDAPVDGLEVYVKGERADPPILLLHELPGLLPETVQFADSLVERHYRVYMPLFFGTFGRDTPLRGLITACGGRNFNCVSTRESRIVPKLRMLRDRIAASHRGQKLGIIGMCLTGGMPLALASPDVAAVVMSQPAIPFPLTTAQRRSLGVSEQSLAAAKASGVFVLRIRFDQDCLVPRERFQAIAAAIPADRLETHEVTSTDRREHSVLTVESHNPQAMEAVRHVYDFFERHLKVAPILPSRNP